MTDSAGHQQASRDTPVLILAGGRSRRMGRDKTLLPLGSETVLQRIARTFAALSDNVILVAGHGASEPAGHPFSRILHDEHPDLGPLEGLRVGLQHLADRPMVIVGTCDAPLVVPEVYLSMLRQLQSAPQTDAVVPRIDGQTWPLTAVYRTRVREVVNRMVAERQLRVRDLLQRIRVDDLDPEEFRKLDPHGKTLRNINTREEYQLLLQELREDPHGSG
jgi:molybdopterin-guanine dinucleotide biosynthesis protein A